MLVVRGCLTQANLSIKSLNCTYPHPYCCQLVFRCHSNRHSSAWSLDHPAWRSHRLSVLREIPISQNRSSIVAHWLSSHQQLACRLTQRWVIPVGQKGKKWIEWIREADGVHNAKILHLRELNYSCNLQLRPCLLQQPSRPSYDSKVHSKFQTEVFRV